MKDSRFPGHLGVFASLLLVAAVVMVAFLLGSIIHQPVTQAAFAIGEPDLPTTCTSLTQPADLPTPALLNFDDLVHDTVIADHYRGTFGVSFENSQTIRALIYGTEPANAHSAPNVAINDAVFPTTNNNVPMVITFDSPKTHVGFYIGNSPQTRVGAMLTAYNIDGQIICEYQFIQIPDPATLFVGVYDSNGGIAKITLDYGDTGVNETIDDLYFSPRPGLPPVRQPLPKWTPIPSPTPTAGPQPTVTPVIPMFSYKKPVNLVANPAVIQPDLSIHGIEITQGIQCFDTSKGLAGCPNNSLPLVARKDSTARIYLKAGGGVTSMDNVPVRLYIIAKGITYTADSIGRAIPVIDQGASDNANIYFNVNFITDEWVDFYAVVDPNNLISEIDETNNRFPALSAVPNSIHLSFQNQTSMKVVGRRVDYHPASYSGTRYAGGWAVNGGAADWWEQLLPIRNNGINYSVASGYQDFTSMLTPCDLTSTAQHALIQMLNTRWTLENILAFWFSGAFTGATHVYGWVPEAGYPCGHADMPVYPHAGGLGVVGIGTDSPGTNTDNPGRGALIFGHELVHDYDLKHTNRADACGSNDSSSSFPYSSSSIQEYGYNPITGRIYNPASTHDLMSYCPAGGSKQGWISPYTWQRMFDELSTPIALTSAPVGPTPLGVLIPSAAPAALEVEAIIYNPETNPDGGGKLGNLHKVDAGVVLALPPGPLYAVDLRDAQGNVLISQSFVVNFESEYHVHENAPPPPFSANDNDYQTVSFIMEWVDGATTVNLTHQGSLLDQRRISSNPPQVLITNPTEPEDWLSGSTHPLEWQGVDLDGDTLLYSVFYSSDGGVNWMLLTSGLSSTQYLVQTDAMAGGADVRFRVVASDGLLTGVAETNQAISIPNHAPQAIILNPTNGDNFLPGDLVLLTGSAVDMEDGTLTDETLQWSSDLQGGLGTGPSLGLISLIPGTHNISLSVADSYGVVSASTVKITVGYQIFMPLLNN